MDCWICGAEADTGEHMIKVTDLHDLFGHTTTHTPLYRTIDKGRSEKVQGKNSSTLKFQTRLCAQCNNTRTQQHDRSWEAFASFLKNRPEPIRPGEVFRPASAFSGGLRAGLLGVHLYFCKLTGCLVHDSDVPLETDSLAAAILGNFPHPNIYLSFLAVTSRRLQSWAMVTPVQAVFVNEALMVTQWFYFVGRIGVHITYATHIHPPDRANLWHPGSTSTRLTLGRW